MWSCYLLLGEKGTVLVTLSVCVMSVSHLSSHFKYMVEGHKSGTETSGLKVCIFVFEKLQLVEMT